MREAISVYESDNSLRSATVYKDTIGYLVVYNDKKDRSVIKTSYNRLDLAEDKAEDWVMYCE